MKKEFMRRIVEKFLVVCLHVEKRRKGKKQEAGRASALIPCDCEQKVKEAERRKVVVLY